MDAPGGRGGPDSGGVDPAAAFFGLWPRIAEHADDEPPGVVPLPRVVADPRPRLRIA
jgi:hypothetical protein